MKNYSRQMSDPAVTNDPARLANLAREQADLEEVVTLYQIHQAAEQELAEAQVMAADDTDPEMAELAPDRDRSPDRTTSGAARATATPPIATRP